jgi:hypothetical protein
VAKKNKPKRIKPTPKTKAEKMLYNKHIAEVIASGRDEAVAAKLGIVLDWLSPATPNEKESAQEDLKKITGEIADMKQKAETLYKKTEGDVLALGKLFIDIKGVLQHGEWMDWCKDAGFVHNRVTYCMARANPTGDKITAGKNRRNAKPSMKERKKFTDYFVALQKAVEKNDVGQANAMHDSIINMLGLMMDGLKKQVTKALGASA